MDTSRLRFGEMIAAVSGAVLFIVLFFKWYGAGGVPDSAKQLGKGLGISIPNISVSVSAWQAFSFTDLLCALAAIIAVGLAVMTMTQRSVALPVAASVLTTAVGGFVALLILYRIINQPGPNDIVTVKFGAYLGFLAAVGIAAGGFLSMQEEGTSLGDAARDLQGGGTGGPGAPAGGRPAGAPPAQPVPPAAPPAQPAPPVAPPPQQPPPGGAPPTGGPPSA
jgi:hypothetical protein